MTSPLYTKNDAQLLARLDPFEAVPPDFPGTYPGLSFVPVYTAGSEVRGLVGPGHYLLGLARL
jgi:hypothetical protein